jgi:aspartyl-tRNA synthetase
MMHAYRTHNCGQLRSTNVGDEVKLSGWVHRKRDHGGVLFVDLRDHYGITQVVADVDSPALPILDGLRVESVVTIEGVVKARSQAAVNQQLATGEVELFARAVTIQSAAQELPMPVFGDQEYPEKSASSIATSTCAASGRTPTSSCAARSSPRSATAWSRRASPSSRPRS